MKWSLRRISGYLAIGLAFLYGSAVSVAFFFFRDAVERLLSPELVVPYWSFVATLFMSHSIETAEHSDETIAEIAGQEFEGLEFYNSADTFLTRLTEISVGAESIATLNFSPPAGLSRALDLYFRAVHGYIQKKGTRLRVFRSIASIEDAAKANWAVHRAHIFKLRPEVSFACFAETQGVQLMCYHVVIKDGVGYCAFYPPVPLTGVMNAVVIVNKRLAQMLTEQFDVAWARSVKLLEGGHPAAQGLTFLKGKGACADTNHFIELAGLAGLLPEGS